MINPLKTLQPADSYTFKVFIGNVLSAFLQTFNISAITQWFVCLKSLFDIPTNFLKENTHTCMYI